ncbi:MAG: hypothetical protein MUF49_25850 [Oculatellaceae cyanobacterium Prado106]|nr:hypothetical protein [Oculatellaceae cyanobacterium Prado106]
MAQIIGTEGPDLLDGTLDSDTLSALGGDDRINSSGGVDAIDGGDGFDTVSYNNNNRLGRPEEGLFNVPVDFIRYFPLRGQVEKISNPTPRDLFISRIDSIQSIERIEGKGASIVSLEGAREGDRAIYDLPNNRITIERPSGSQTFNVTLDSFSVFEGTTGADQFQGTSGSAPTFFGLAGDDTYLANGTRGSFAGGAGNDTADFATQGSAVTVSIRSLATPAPTARAIYQLNGIYSTGNDQVSTTVENLLLPAGQTNNLVINSDDPQSPTALDADLSQNRVTVNSPNFPFGSLNTYTMNNLVNVSGGALADQITGNTANNELNGAGENDTLNGGDGSDRLNGDAGSDTLSGGNGNDTLSGTNTTSRGVGELDTLTGDAGRDKLIGI